MQGLHLLDCLIRCHTTLGQIINNPQHARTDRDIQTVLWRLNVNRAAILKMDVDNAIGDNNLQLEFEITCETTDISNDR